MPTISKYVEVTQEQLRTIAAHIEAWIEKTKTTHQGFADKYNQLRQQRCRPGTVATMDRFRVLAFLNLARGKTSSRIAKVPYCQETELIAALIGIPVEELVGQESESTRHVVKVAESSAEAAAFLKLLSSRQPETRELIGLAEFLPCSLETPEFMHAHHSALFPDNPGDVMVWDGIGHARRAEVFSGRRKWRMTQLNFLSDLKAIASGDGYYKDVAASVRKSCLENLIQVLSNRDLNVRMLIANDEKDDAVRALRKDVSFYDSVITWDEQLAIVRDRFGIAYYSDRKRYTKYWRGVQEEFIDLAEFSDAKAVIAVINSLSETVPAEGKRTTSERVSTKRGANAWARQQ